MHVEKKTFNWTLTTLGVDTMELNFMFDHPSYISQDVKPDTIKITFLNTPYYLIPQDSSKMTLPNGYQVNVKLVPQEDISTAVMQKQQAENAE